MKRLLLILAAGMSLAMLVRADPAVVPLYIGLGNATAKTTAVANVSGYVDEVIVSVVGGGSITGDVSVSYAPLGGAAAAVTMAASNTVVGSYTWRPRVDTTDSAGVALTSDPPTRYALSGETVTFVVTGSPTNKTWRADIKLAKYPTRPAVHTGRRGKAGSHEHRTNGNRRAPGDTFGAPRAICHRADGWQGVPRHA